MLQMFIKHILPFGTSGALQRQLRIDITGWNVTYGETGSERNSILEHNSASMTRSNIIGEARSESSHVLCTTNVL